jgi:hypothetical protein
VTAFDELGGSPVVNLASVKKVNGIVARYQAFTSALVALSDVARFPDKDGRLRITPENFEPRKNI